MDAVSHSWVRRNSKVRRRRFYEPRGVAPIVGAMTNPWLVVFSREGLSGEHP
jgi:hypothetical protein